MSEEPVEVKGQRINLDKVLEFFDSNGISMECPICQTDTWNIPNAKSVGGNALPWGTGKGNMFNTGLPILVMVCTKCKFVRQHSLLDDAIPGAVEDF